MFAVVADGNGTTSAARIQQHILGSGIQLDDFRLRTTMERLRTLGESPISFEAFVALVSDELMMVNRTFNRELVIPDWQEFCHDIELVFNRIAGDCSGHNANYIPILRDADPDKWGVALCSVDGQRLEIGDVDTYHSIQSVSKPITYAFAIEEEGTDFVHQFVGAEPSGRPFNSLELLPDSRPFNPCVNAGAIMTAGVVASSRTEQNAREITEEIMKLWAALSGDLAPVRFSEETMLSERDTADNNFAIAYLLRGGRGLPRGVDLHKMLDLYLSCCSIEMTASLLSVAAATLANGGVCPITGQQALSTEAVKKSLSVMQAAGMYDNAGVFTLEVGLPAKSGVSGAVMTVVPNLMGFATFSPRLDAYGNSVRGVAFCRQLVELFTFHIYDSLSGGRSGCKRDPRASQHNRKQRDLGDLRWAVSHGDRYAIKVRDLLLECMIAITLADGEIEEPEIVIMAETYTEIMGHQPQPGELQAMAESRQSEIEAVGSSGPFEQLLQRLSLEQAQLDDNVRELILEAAFRVACADGIIEPEEDHQLRGIANALGISEGVLELEIARFQRQHPPQSAAAANGAAGRSGSACLP
ncbi:MAG: glutaminase A [Cyanobacteria bacterium]|nr:glutaminase A [Cyanobacteriota bacterium]